MQIFKLLLLIIVIGSLISSCSTSIKHKDETYNPQTQEIEHHKYTQFYQLKTEIIPQNLELILVTQLHKKTIPGAYSVMEFTRRLLPNDNLAKGTSTLYLKNLSVQTIKFDLLAISIEQKHLPLSARTLNLSANQSTSIPMGEINIDLRLDTLNTRIEYIADGVAIKKEHREKEFDLLRSVQRIKEDNKKMPGQVVE